MRAARMDRKASRAKRGPISGKGHGVSRRDGGPWPLRPAVPGVRLAGAAHRLCGERDELLRALPDRRQAARRPRAFAAAEEKLAAQHRRARLTRVARAMFRFHGPLGLFLPKERRNTAFSYDCAHAATLKNAIEALGVPHTEVGRLTVNGAAATLQRAVREDDAVEVFAQEKQSVDVPSFLADAHLGGLARFLRMLGFDTLYENGISDEAIRRLAREEKRIVLTRDRELLKCAD